MKTAEIAFMVNKQKIEFRIVHNLDDVFGLSLTDALHNWLARTKVFTPESLCEYILSKQPDKVAIPENQLL